MRFLEALHKLKKSSEYQAWVKNHLNSYLSYGFIMISADVKKEWQIGFYNPGEDSLTTFTVADKILKNPDSEVFKNNSKIQELNIHQIKINIDKALEIADSLQKEKYNSHDPMKKIAILQTLELGQVWNITYVTQTFKTLNIKIDSSTGKLVKYDLIDLFRVEK